MVSDGSGAATFWSWFVSDTVSRRPSNVLIDGSLVGHAEAQTTPSPYCASLAAVSCEVLNVEPIGYNGLNDNMHFLIKMCRNQKFETRLFSMEGSPLGAYTWAPYDNGSGYVKFTSPAFDTATYLAMFQGATSVSGRAPLNLAGGCF